MDLKEAREAVREADRQMAALFERRMAAVREVAAYKKERGMQILDREQEKRVLERNSAFIEDDVLRPYYLSFLQSTMDVSKRYQEWLIRGDGEGAVCKEGSDHF